MRRFQDGAAALFLNGRFAVAKQEKTNVMRVLDRAGIPYSHYSYEHNGNEAVDGVTVAQRIGRPVGQVFKTLVTRGASRNFFVFVIPVAEELDLKAAAAAVGVKSVEMIHVAEITALTGYVRGGCSPIGMKKRFPTVIDVSAQAFDTIIFSGGRIGTQVEMAPSALAGLIGASFAAIVRGRC